MTESLYERYKDALRRGHVAITRGRLDAAIVAYGEAAEIAPERALPHISLAAVLVKLKRTDEALAAYGRALELSPRDEQALGGRADVLARLGRATDAADDLDRLAEVYAAAGRLADALDTARSALELAESRTRRRTAEAFAQRIRERQGDEAAAAALARAKLLLEPPIVAEPEPGSFPEPPPDGTLLASEGEERLLAGDFAGGLRQLLAAMAAHRRDGHVDAALDAGYIALSIAPDHPALHLTLAELYLDRGWRAPAAEKLVLLGRLVGLAEDVEARQRICAIAAERFPDDPRLAALCA